MKFSPASTGLILMIYPLILSVVAPISGHLSDKIGSEILTFIGLSAYKFRVTINVNFK